MPTLRFARFMLRFALVLVIVGFAVAGISIPVGAALPYGGELVYWKRGAIPGRDTAIGDLFLLDVNRQNAFEVRVSGHRVQPGACWLADGEHMLVRDGESQVLMSEANGANAEQLTDQLAFRASPLCWQGTNGAYIAAEGENVFYNFETGTRQSLLNSEYGSLTSDFDFSPDGTRVAFTGLFANAPYSDVRPQLFLYDMNADQTRTIFASDRGGRANMMNPAWSPDGQWIAFTQRFRMLRINPETRETRIVYDFSATQNVEARPSVSRIRWSPDGSRVAFEYTQPAPTYTDRDILIADIESGEITRLASLTHDYLYPDWSPDSERLVFVSRNDRGSELLVYNVRHATIELIVSHTTPVIMPRWRPTGR